MRFLLVNYEYPPIGGGAATATEKIAQGLLALGHEVTVLTAAFGDLRGKRDEHGVLVWRVPALRARADRSSMREMASYVASAVWAMPRVLREYRPEAVITFFSVPCGPVGWWASRLGRIPYVVSLRGGDVPGTERSLDRMHRLLAPFRRRILRDALAVVANSNGLKTLSEHADPVPVTVIVNGVDHERFKPVIPTQPRQAFRFLFVGRLNEQKNVALLLWAFADLAKQQAPAARLKIVGDGPLKPALLAQTHALGIADLVEWAPWQSREAMLGLYAEADCLVNPSLYEGMPNVVLEAMACGVPVIASAVAGNIDVIEDDVDGLLFPSCDQLALSDALCRILADPVAAKRIGLAARQRVVRNYSWLATADAYADLFKAEHHRESYEAI
ncbi:MAG: glycosyltransferase family 4 protein [Sulfuritalea sp.]|nr:glycosyltransferase family 4 protein [Sulfuritalea sp.]